MSLTIASRPASIDGCFQTWSEQNAPRIIRTNMDNPASVKTRLRFTAPLKKIECSVVLKSTVYQDFINWHEVNCQGGIYPTRIKRPDTGQEIVARFTECPKIEFLERNVFRANCVFEVLPEWRAL
jgi:hypothetical protein